MTHHDSPTLDSIPRLLLRLAIVLALLLLTAAGWWWLPVRPFATLPAGEACKRLRVSANGRFLLAVHQSHLTVWDLEHLQEAGRCPFRWVDNDPMTENLWFSSDGLKVAFVTETAEGYRVYLWNRTVQPALRKLPSGTCIFASVLDSDTLITTGQGYQLWDAGTRKEILQPVCQFDQLANVQYLPACRKLVGFEQGKDEEGRFAATPRLILWTDLAGQATKVVFPGTQLPALVSPDGQLLAVICQQRIRLYDLPTGQLRAELPTAPSAELELPLQFSPDSRLLVTVPDWFNQLGKPPTSRDVRHTIWDVRPVPPRRLTTLRVADVIGPLLFSPDGRWAAIWERPPTPAGTSPSYAWACRFFDTSSWEPQGSLPPVLNNPPAFAPHGQTVAANMMEENSPTLLQQWLQPTRGGVPFPVVKVWETPSGRQVAALRGGRCFAYLPDGQRLALATEGGSIELWDIPPRRAWWVEYGLPTGFALLLLLGMVFGRRGSSRTTAPPGGSSITTRTVY